MHLNDICKSAMDLEEPAFQLALTPSFKHSQHSMEEDDLAPSGAWTGRSDGGEEAAEQGIYVTVRELQRALERLVEIQPVEHKLQVPLELSLQNIHFS